MGGQPTIVGIVLGDAFAPIPVVHVTALELLESTQSGPL
jgi:hypothetical protein